MCVLCVCVFKDVGWMHRFAEATGWAAASAKAKSHTHTHMLTHTSTHTPGADLARFLESVWGKACPAFGSSYHRIKPLFSSSPWLRQSRLPPCLAGCAPPSRAGAGALRCCGRWWLCLARGAAACAPGTARRCCWPAGAGNLAWRVHVYASVHASVWHVLRRILATVVWCVHAYTIICMYVFMLVRMHVCVHGAYECTHACRHVSVHTCMYMSANECACISRTCQSRQSQLPQSAPYEVPHPGPRHPVRPGNDLNEVTHLQLCQWSWMVGPGSPSSSLPATAMPSCKLQHCFSLRT